MGNNKIQCRKILRGPVNGIGAGIGDIRPRQPAQGQHNRHLKLGAALIDRIHWGGIGAKRCGTETRLNNDALAAEYADAPLDLFNGFADIRARINGTKRHKFSRIALGSFSDFVVGDSSPGSACRAAGKNNAHADAGLFHLRQEQRHGVFQSRGNGTGVRRGKGKFLKGLGSAEQRELFKAPERGADSKINNHGGLPCEIVSHGEVLLRKTIHDD